MAQLTGPSPFRLDLTPLRYQFPGNTGDWDADWLVVKMHAADGNRDWESVDPAFLTWELRSLVEWLRALASGTEGDENWFGCVEPNLQFSAARDAAGICLRAVFEQEFRPPGTRIDEPGEDEEIEIEFRPSPEQLRRFADQLDAELEPFPVRRPLTR